jgi:hypothetical protein
MSLHVISRRFSEVSAGAFFALSRSRAQRQKRARKREEKKREKAKAPSAKEKALIRAFSYTYSVNPVLEPKATRQGGKQGS